MKKIPVTVITGFLGSGKTTLINRILTEEHGIRFAIIENEFGEVGIDQDIIRNEKEEIIEMNNGCICCTVRGDLIRIIKKLANSERPPEYILIETTGLADPSPVAQTFLSDSEIENLTYLDGIITLVDAKYAEAQLTSAPETKDQVAFADIIVLNKIDLVSSDQTQKVENRLREINRFAKILHSTKGDVEWKELFNVGGFDVERGLSINPKFLEVEYPFEFGSYLSLSKGVHTLTASPHGEEKTMKFLLTEAVEKASKESLEATANHMAVRFSVSPTRIHKSQVIEPGNDLGELFVEDIGTKFLIRISHEKTYALFTEHSPKEFDLKIEDSHGNADIPIISREFRSAHSHDSSVSSVGIEAEGELDAQAFVFFIDMLLKAFGSRLYRYKGILPVQGEKMKVVLQGVHMLYEIQPGKEWGENEIKKSTIVFIGKDLDRNLITQGFLSCIRKPFNTTPRKGESGQHSLQGSKSTSM